MEEPFLGYVWAAYGVTGFGVAALVAHATWRLMTVRAQLRRLEHSA